jgi:hypothetical protein
MTIQSILILFDELITNPSSEYVFLTFFISHKLKTDVRRHLSLITFPLGYFREFSVSSDHKFYLVQPIYRLNLSR